MDRALRHQSLSNVLLLFSLLSPRPEHASTEHIQWRCVWPATYPILCFHQRQLYLWNERELRWSQCKRCISQYFHTLPMQSHLHLKCIPSLREIWNSVKYLWCHIHAHNYMQKLNSAWFSPLFLRPLYLPLVSTPIRVPNWHSGSMLLKRGWHKNASLFPYWRLHQVSYWFHSGQDEPFLMIRKTTNFNLIKFFKYIVLMFFVFFKYATRQAVY